MIMNQQVRHNMYKKGTVLTVPLNFYLQNL